MLFICKLNVNLSLDFFARALSFTHEDLPSSETCSETHRLSIVRFPDIAEFISFPEAFHYDGKT